MRRRHAQGIPTAHGPPPNVRIVSLRGNGTRLDFHSAAMLADVATTTTTSHMRVLLVEDDDDLREALADALTERGHDVVMAADGLDGLRKLRDAGPDVVVLDLMMPQLDGWQFRIAQRGDPMLATTPVVAISASSSASAAAVDADLF
jgi:CheY-like chemotaxis protein